MDIMKSLWTLVVCLASASPLTGTWSHLLVVCVAIHILINHFGSLGTTLVGLSVSS